MSRAGASLPASVFYHNPRTIGDASTSWSHLRLTSARLRLGPIGKWRSRLRGGMPIGDQRHARALRPQSRLEGVDRIFHAGDTAAGRVVELEAIARSSRRGETDGFDVRARARDRGGRVEVEIRRRPRPSARFPAPRPLDAHPNADVIVHGHTPGGVDRVGPAGGESRRCRPGSIRSGPSVALMTVERHRRASSTSDPLSPVIRRGMDLPSAARRTRKWSGG